MLDTYDKASDIPITVNQRNEIIVPFFQLGVAEFVDGALVALWEIFKDWSAS